MKVGKQIKSIVKAQLGINELIKISKDLHKGDWGVDSLDEIEIIIKVEERFDIEILDSEAETINTVRDLIKMVKSKLK